MKYDREIEIIGYDELTEHFHEQREAAFNSDMVFDSDANWDPETNSIELKNDYCHRGAPMRVFYRSHPATDDDYDSEILVFRCVICNQVVMKIRVGGSGREDD